METWVFNSVLFRLYYHRVCYLWTGSVYPIQSRSNWTHLDSIWSCLYISRGGICSRIFGFWENWVELQCSSDHELCLLSHDSELFPSCLSRKSYVHVHHFLFFLDWDVVQSTFFPKPLLLKCIRTKLMHGCSSYTSVLGLDLSYLLYS